MSEFEELYGPLARGEYEIGQVVRYHLPDSNTVHEGEILWCYAPGVTPVSKKHHPLSYVVDTGGFPAVIYQSDILSSF